MSLTKLQQVIFSFVFILLAGIVAFFLVYSDTRENTKKLVRDASALDAKILDAKATKKAARDLEEKKNLLEDQLNKLKRILPAKINKPKFFQNIRRMANEQGLEVTNAGGNKPVTDQDIIEHPFSFQVRGNYHDLGNFFAKLSDYTNIINIKGLSLMPNSNNPAYSISASFIVSVFSYKEPTAAELAEQLEAKKLEMEGGGLDKNKPARKRGGK